MQTNQNTELSQGPETYGIPENQVKLIQEMAGGVDIDELMDRDPQELSRTDIQAVIVRMRQLRAEWKGSGQAGRAKRAPKKPATKKADPKKPKVDIADLDLNLEP